jgi:hypothetical protein
MTPEQREKRIDRLFPWVAQPAPNFRGTVKSGTEFPKPTCPAGTEPVVQPIMPDLVAQSAGNQRVAVFYRETPGGGVIHLQTKASKGSWQEVAGISVRYLVDCHP